MRSTRHIDRFAYAHDASHFLLIPKAVEVIPDMLDMTRLMHSSDKHLTFRSGGTSLSGQASTDGILVDVRKNFRAITVLDNGARVIAQPGATLKEVNIRLAKYGYKLGPDPASEAACTIGGVIANNSSGMICGTEFNTYKTLESLVLILPNGNVINTSGKDADDRLRIIEPLIYEGLIRLRERIRNNPRSIQKIKELFSIKNTMGYGINSFLDFERPIDIFAHLIVGSEGTLGFIAEATFRTVPIKPHVATGFLLFNSMTAATSALPELISTGVSAIELLDATSLKVAKSGTNPGQILEDLKVQEHAGLLIEYQELTDLELINRLEPAESVLSRLSFTSSTGLFRESKIRSNLWHMRKGLYASVAGARTSGTTALLEDIAVPILALAKTCEELTKLFSKFGYTDSVIFGHAKDGNIHFMLNEDFTNTQSTERYLRFTEEMVDLVLSHNGTLKAEHGTGRVMAPFVRKQYGDELYLIMREIKDLFDPANKLNPGVIISNDSKIHVKFLKTTPAVEKEVDLCVECGYCEPVCPSKDLTLTPRQRIVIRREMERARLSGEVDLYRSLKRDYQYAGIDTCAVDGMCSTACPVLIDTGELVKRLRGEQMPKIQRFGWAFLANNWGLVTKMIGVGLTTAKKSKLTKFPKYSKDLPTGGEYRKSIKATSPTAIYFPSCTSSLFDSNVRESFLKLCKMAGIEIISPAGIGDLCCGQPWKSKGAEIGYQKMAFKTKKWIDEATKKESLVVISDAASCTQSLSQFGAVIDIIDFVDQRIIQNLQFRQIDSIAIHPTCSSTKSGGDDALLRIARMLSKSIYIPDNWSCCGFAGDRGILFPELTSSATRLMAQEINMKRFDAYVSNNRTCEIGMSRATGRRYRHIIELVSELVIQ